MTLHADDRDPSVDPGVDFYRYASGHWLDTHDIPPGYGAWGAFEEVQKRTETLVHDLLLAATESPADELDRLLGDYFASGMDTDSIGAAGLAPVQGYLDLVDAVTSHADVLALLPRLHRDYVVPLFAWAVEVDHDDSRRHLFWFAQGGLGLPDRESYFSDTEAQVSLRAAYVDHVARQLVNAGTDADAAAAVAPEVLALETRLAETHLKAEERRDPHRYLNRFDVTALAEVAPGLGLPGYLEALGATGVGTVNVQNPAYFAALHGVLISTDLATLRAYLRFHVLRSAASSLHAAVEDESFDFYGRRIQGQTEPKDRYQRVVAAIGADIGEALGQCYVARYFPPSAKDRAVHLVEAIIEEMRESLRTRTWMSAETRERALVKLDAFGVKIGYPDVWRDWSGLDVRRDAYCANRIAASRFEVDRMLARLQEDVDRNEWEMPPHIINAYYHPLRNEIVFPAGILQPPFFDPEADDAVNFGGIGTVIAHEVSHGFDDAGRRFDADGAFRDWWTPEDQEHFTSLADRVVAQFDEYVAIGDVHVNGQLTLGENIADLGGLMLAHRALARVVPADAPEIDGMTPSQRFFLANATLWRGNVSENLSRTLAATDSHSPRHLRVRGPFSNSSAFQEAFALTDDAPMLRPREDRIEIW